VKLIVDRGIIVSLGHGRMEWCRVSLLSFPRARQLYRTESLYPPARPMTAAVLRTEIKERYWTIACLCMRN